MQLDESSSSGEKVASSRNGDDADGGLVKTGREAAVEIDRDRRHRVQLARQHAAELDSLRVGAMLRRRERSRGLRRRQIGPTSWPDSAKMVAKLTAATSARAHERRVQPSPKNVLVARNRFPRSPRYCLRSGGLGPGAAMLRKPGARIGCTRGGGGDLPGFWMLDSSKRRGGAGRWRWQ